MLATRIVGAAGALLLAAALSPGFAQTSPSAPAGSSGSTTSTTGSGTTSGPAAGSPTTLGTSGNTTATPHQQQGVKDQSSSVTREEEHGAGSGSSQAPHGPAAGQPGAEGSKSGPASERRGSGSSKE
jgi:hypothetical protein